MPVNTRRVTQFGQSIELNDDSAVMAVTMIDTATGNPVPNPLTNTELRSGVIYTSQGAPANKTFNHYLYTDGTVDGGSGGSRELAGAYSPESPRIVYRTFAADTIVERLQWLMVATAALGMGYGAGVPLANGLRVEVTAGTPTDASAAATWRAIPRTGAGNLTDVSANWSLGLGDVQFTSNFNTVLVVTANLRGGIVIPAGSSFRIIAQDTTTSGNVLNLQAIISGRTL